MASSSGSKKAVDQYSCDAKLLNEFEISEEEPGSSFHYTKSVISSKELGQDDKINKYLLKMQRGGFIQSFGCLLVVEEGSFQIAAHSENAMGLFGIDRDTLLGCDARTLFNNFSNQGLMVAAAARDISIANPVMVASEIGERAFYAILHKLDVGIVIDLEPVLRGNPCFTERAKVEAHNRAFSAVSGMQNNSRGNISALCDNVANFVKNLTNYDRVMVYKFHQDEHGEIVSEVKRPDLEPYLGLHFPETDIPQAARFLFLQNRLRMICDARTDPVSIVQIPKLDKPLFLGSSTLRAPHGCHTQYMVNMNSIGSLVMAIVVRENNRMRLWGFVSCHHTGPRYLPYPMRCACEFVMQAFGSQLSLELQWVAHMAEKKILKTQVLLCAMVLRDDPFGIVSRSPNIMDLVPCEGAAFYYKGVCRVLGVTPSEMQTKGLIEWVFALENDLSVWNTDSLLGIGYPYASALNGICGVAVARITSNDAILWFRSATEKEVNWVGARQHPTDDGEIMHPRSSFKAYLEVLKNKSFEWETWEINAIRSLRDAVNNCFMKMEQDNQPLVTLQLF